MDTRASYDSAAKAYAEHLADELAHKPLDRHLLNRFAEETRGRGLVADFGCGPVRQATSTATGRPRLHECEGHAEDPMPS